MNIKSLKIRLTLWYFISIFVVAGIVFTSFYLVTEQTLYSNTDSLIASHSNKIKNIIIDNSKTSHSANDKNVFQQEFNDMPGMVVAITDSSGGVVGGSALTINSSDTFSHFLTESVNGDQPRFENGKVANSSMRFMISPLYQNTTFLGTLIVGHPIDVIQNSLHNLVWKLIFIFLGLAILGMFGGYFIAKQALLPITKMSSKMRSISHKNFNDRVEIPETKDEMQELAITFNDLLGRLSLAFTREHQFIEDVAHELKTPLAILKSRVEISLSKKRTTENYRRDMADALQDIDHLDSTIKDILDLAWSESENEAKQMGSIDLSKIVAELTKDFSSLASKKNIALTSKVEPEIHILGKKDRIGRAFANVVNNSIKYTGSGGSISVELKRDGKSAILIINDNGIGISKIDMPHIFDRFWRGSKNTNIPGNGLGLSIVRSVITAHKGQVIAESSENGGTKITIQLPLSC